MYSNETLDYTTVYKLEFFLNYQLCKVDISGNHFSPFVFFINFVRLRKN